MERVPYLDSTFPFLDLNLEGSFLMVERLSRTDNGVKLVFFRWQCCIFSARNVYSLRKANENMEGGYEDAFEMMIVEQISEGKPDSLRYFANPNSVSIFPNLASTKEEDCRQVWC
jgi:hypothetical protein